MPPLPHNIYHLFFTICHLHDRFLLSATYEYDVEKYVPWICMMSLALFQQASEHDIHGNIEISFLKGSYT